ncbi:DNA cytosine methyltransferase [Streptomyces sp. NBC_01285]|uniref:DNA cytosine methyltransferase n=1 Tax=Streptomyces sp. NBC_01285 TaxID=2903813 RepID=UPI00225785F8|nr:DNA cytosine methyltransferase [Streptomyces sp. NBC_01285]MCX4772363.1 DNA cytosine methyltransferase [Streptomyces sp. NBC_01285]
MTHAPHSPLQPAHFRIVDLFAGPGGLDIAATVMGVESIGVEWDDATRATREAAGLLTTVEKDVAVLSACDPQVRDANVLTGGPPCQSFSVAGSRKGHKALDDVKRLATSLVGHEDVPSFEAAWKEAKAETDTMSDERTGLVLQPLRWIMEAKLSRGKPYDVVVLEQVPTVLPVWKHYAELLRQTGYAADAHVLYSEDFGVPQTRRRAVLIAQWDPNNVKREVQFPRATHQRYRKGIKRLPKQTRQDTGPEQDGSLFPTPKTDIAPWVAMQDVLTDRPRDFEVVSNYGSGGDPKNRGRRTSDQPAATVTGKFRRNKVFLLKETESGNKDIGEELERLTFEEGGLLQSFPRQYPWRSTDVAQQIGNAIPPLLSLHILSSALRLGSPEEELIEKLVSWEPESPDTQADEVRPGNA